MACQARLQDTRNVVDVKRGRWRSSKECFTRAPLSALMECALCTRQQNYTSQTDPSILSSACLIFGCRRKNLGSFVHSHVLLLIYWTLFWPNHGWPCRCQCNRRVFPPTMASACPSSTQRRSTAHHGESLSGRNGDSVILGSNSAFQVI